MNINTQRLITRISIAIIFTPAVGICLFLFWLTRDTPEAHSSPSLPVGSWVWAKLERSSPLYKTCDSSGTQSIQYQIGKGACSAILIENGEFRLANWSFPPDLDFHQTDSIALESSTDIVNSLLARFGKQYLVNLDAATERNAEFEAAKARKEHPIPDDLRIAFASPPLAEAQNSPGTYSTVDLAEAGRSQRIYMDEWHECGMSAVDCGWNIADDFTNSEGAPREHLLLRGRSLVYKMERLTNGYHDLVTTGDFGAIIYRFDAKVYQKTECYRPGTGSEPLLIKTDDCTHYPFGLQ